MPQDRIYFFDTTLRDGEQSPGCSMTHHEKLALAHSLADLGVDILEAGFAIASDGDFTAISAIAQEVRGPKIASLARARQDDIERAAKAVEKAARPRIHVFLASSDIHLEYKLKISGTRHWSRPRRWWRWRGPMRTMWSFPRKIRRGRTRSFCASLWGQRSARELRRSTCRTRWGMRHRRIMRGCFA